MDAAVALGAAFGRYGPDPAPTGEGVAARDIAATTNGGPNPLTATMGERR